MRESDLNSIIHDLGEIPNSGPLIETFLATTRRESIGVSSSRYSLSLTGKASWEEQASRLFVTLSTRPTGIDYEASMCLAYVCKPEEVQPETILRPLAQVSIFYNRDLLTAVDYMGRYVLSLDPNFLEEKPALWILPNLSMLARSIQELNNTAHPLDWRGIINDLPGPKLD